MDVTDLQLNVMSSFFTGDIRQHEKANPNVMLIENVSKWNFLLVSLSTNKMDAINHNGTSYTSVLFDIFKVLCIIEYLAVALKELVVIGKDQIMNLKGTRPTAAIQTSPGKNY